MSSKKSSIDQGLIRDLAKLLKEADLSEIEIEQPDLRIRVTRSLGQSPVNVVAPIPASAPESSAPKPAPVESPSPDNADPSKHPGAVKSPMVGTAYLAAEPGADPFVKAGDTVNAGQTVMIVEAMKTMNPITAHRAGTVKSVLVENAQPVEYGEPLMIIE